MALRLFQYSPHGQMGMLTLVEGPFDESLLDTCWLAIAAKMMTRLIQRQRLLARRICNVVDAPKAASFIMPSIIDRSPPGGSVSGGTLSGSGAPVARKPESLLPLHLGQ